MTSIEKIFESALSIHGPARVQDRMLTIKSNQELRQIPDNDYLSYMSRRIFRAGLRHAMVDAKWPAFEQVFRNFEIEYVRMMSDDELDLLMRDQRIIRHWGKLKSVRTNAQSIFEVIQEAGSFGTFLAAWSPETIVDLWLLLKKRFAHMGGNSSPYFLRMVGKDTFLLTRDVIRALNFWGVYNGMPRSQQAIKEVQAIFNRWQQESGKPLCQISMILALSTEAVC